MAGVNEGARTVGTTRERLLTVATALLEAEGVEAVTLRAVGAQANLSRQTPYRHFANKDDMLGAVAAEGFRRLHERLAQAAAVAAPDDALPGMVRVYLAFASAHPTLSRLMFGPEVREHRLVRHEAQQVYQYLVRVIAESPLGGGVPDATPRQLATLVFAATHGLIALALAGHQEQEKALDDPASVLGLLLRVLQPGQHR